LEELFGVGVGQVDDWDFIFGGAIIAVVVVRHDHLIFTINLAFDFDNNFGVREGHLDILSNQADVMKE